MDMYLVTWQHVSAINYPEYYRGEDPCVLPEEVPNFKWSQCTREYENKEEANAHFEGLTALKDSKELVRNIAIYKAEIKPPEWKMIRVY